MEGTHGSFQYAESSGLRILLRRFLSLFYNKKVVMRKSILSLSGIKPMTHHTVGV